MASHIYRNSRQFFKHWQSATFAKCRPMSQYYPIDENIFGLSDEQIQVSYKVNKLFSRLILKKNTLLVPTNCFQFRTKGTCPQSE